MGRDVAQINYKLHMESGKSLISTVYKMEPQNIFSSPKGRLKNFGKYCYKACVCMNIFLCRTFVNRHFSFIDLTPS
jgi:hypothetical protein